MVVSCPVDLVKIKLQVQTDVRLGKKYQGPFDVLKKVYQAEGIKGCYRGLTIQSFRYSQNTNILGDFEARQSTMVEMVISTVFKCRDIPTFGCYVVIYDSLSKELEERSGLNAASRTILSGGTAGTSFKCCWMLGG